MKKGQNRKRIYNSNIGIVAPCIFQFTNALNSEQEGVKEIKVDIYHVDVFKDDFRIRHSHSLPSICYN